MKGKKVDHLYLNNFISQCLLENKHSMQEIISSAQQKIKDIDLEIQKVEELKKTRSKLIDVVNILDKSEKIKYDYSKILDLFKINNHNLAKKIIKNTNQSIDILQSLAEDSAEVLFCFKQLLQFHVLVCNNNIISCGEMYQDYKIFVLREAE